MLIHLLTSPQIGRSSRINEETRYNKRMRINSQPKPPKTEETPERAFSIMFLSPSPFTIGFTEERDRNQSLHDGWPSQPIMFWEEYAGNLNIPLSPYVYAQKNYKSDKQENNKDSRQIFSQFWKPLFFPRISVVFIFLYFVFPSVYKISRLSLS